MIWTEYMVFQYGNGVTTGTLRQYRLNFIDDFNATMNKYKIPANAWDPQGSATRMDSNQSIVAPKFDSALMIRMNYRGRAAITDTTSYTTAITGLIAGTYVF